MSEDNNNSGECQDCKFPSKLTQAKNLGLSIANVISNAVQSKGIKASDEEIARRLKICSTCPYRLDNRCSKCGCYIALKAGLAGEKCPINKWDPTK